MNTLERPPGPHSRVFGLDLFRDMQRDYLSVVQRLHEQYGDLVYTRVAHEDVYDLFHPELARELLVDHARSVIRWERGMEVFGALHGQSVLITEGATWQRQRRMLQPGFGQKRMAGYALLMVSAAQSALAALPSSARFEVDFSHWMSQLTMEVILQTLFSRSDAEQCLRAEAAVRTLSLVGMRELFWPMNLPDWMPHKTGKRRAKRVLHELIHAQIEARRQMPDAQAQTRDDLLAMLLAARDEDADATGQTSHLSDQEIHDQCMTMFLAGHETSASALVWWAGLMAAHPEVAERAGAEVTACLGERPPGYSDLEKLPYLMQTLREGLRLFPPAPVLLTRRTIDTVQVGGWTIPAGAMVRVTPWIIHHDERWFETPSAFKPERFEGGSASHQARGQFIPFGIGPRICIGQLFAMTEMGLIAAMLLQRFRLAGARMGLPQLDVLLRPAGGLRLTLERRTP